MLERRHELASLSKWQRAQRQTMATRPPSWRRADTKLRLVLILCIVQLLLCAPYHCALSNAGESGTKTKAHVKIGVLLEESDHEQANMFIRTIKMINEQKDETISRLLGMFARGGIAGSRGLARASFKLSAQDSRQVKLVAKRGELGRGTSRGTNQAGGVVASGANGPAPDRRTMPIGLAVRAKRPEAMEASDEGEQKQWRRWHHSKHEYRDKESISSGNNGGANNKAITSAAASMFGIFGARSGAEQPGQSEGGGGGGGDAEQDKDDDGHAQAQVSPGDKRLHEFDIKLEPMIEFLADRQSALEADQKVCQLVESGVRAIIGPADGASIQHVQSICDNLEIPYFELRTFLGGSPNLIRPPLAQPVTPSQPAAPGLLAPKTSPTYFGPNGSAHPVKRSPPPATNPGRPNSEQPTFKSSPQTSIGLLSADGAQLRHANCVTQNNGAPIRVRRTKHYHDDDDDDDGGAAATTNRPDYLNKDSGQLPVVLSGKRPMEREQRQPSLEASKSSSSRRLSKMSPKALALPFESARASSLLVNNGQKERSHAKRDTTGGFKSSSSELSNASLVISDSNGGLAQNFPDQRQILSNLNDNGPTNGGLDNNGSNDDDDDDQLTAANDIADGESEANNGGERNNDRSLKVHNSTNLNKTRSSQTVANTPDTFVIQSKRFSKESDPVNSNSSPADHVMYDKMISSMSTQSAHISPANKLDDITLNLYPPSHLLNSAYIDMIYALNWTSFAVIYEDSNSMIKLQDLLRESSGSWTNRWRIKLFRVLDTPLNDNQHDEIQRTKSSSESYFSRQNSQNNQQQLQDKAKSQHNTLSPIDITDSHSITVTASQEQASSQRHHQTVIAHDKHNITAAVVDHCIRDKDCLSGYQINSDKSNERVDKDEPGLLNNEQSPRVKVKEKNQGTFRDVFWRVKSSGEYNILLDVKTENLFDALKQAQQVGCMTEEYSYLITSLDLHMVDLEDFKYSRTKITGFSLIQVAKSDHSFLRTTKNNDEAPNGYSFDEKYLENLGVHSASSADHVNIHRINIKSNKGQWQNNAKSTGKSQMRSSSDVFDGQSNSDKVFDFYSNYIVESENNDQTRVEMLQSSPASLGLLPTVDRNNEQRLFGFFIEQQERNMSKVRISTASAILHDSLMLFTLALNELDPSGKIISNGETNVACSLGSQPWPHGSTLVNYMRRMSFDGLTGSISFDQRGLRAEFKLDVLGMAPNIRLIKVGEWHSRQALENGHRSRNNSDPIQLDENNDKSSWSQSIDDARSYDELSQKYENQLQRYIRMLANGEQVDVPYTHSVLPNGALKVNDIIFERLYREQTDQIDTLIVTAKLSQPYFMLKETPNKLEGNDQFEGYAVDLIHELSKLVNFKYKWREVADKKYGSKEVLPNGTVVWNGMIGEIVRGQADLAIVDLTITTQRQEAVDFTLPFMNTGISILFKKPTTKVTTLFSFLSPFSSDVWAYVLAAYCSISAILFLVGHISPYEWADPHPCGHLNQDDQIKILKNQFSLLNSFWFTIGSLMQQGSDLTPRSMSTRTIAGIWYFFTLIMISSYTANLAAFLTVEKVVYPIENVRDLSNQQEIKYGCVESGSTCLFFHDSQIDTYKKIDQTMSKYKTYVRSNDEGQKRVGEGKFAFFMESTTIEYIIERNCNLTQIGGLIDSKGYGLATSKKPRHKRPYRTLLNEGILHLQETGMLHVLKNRWWKERRGGGTCTDDGKGGGVTELSLANVGGVFVVLLGGLGISFLVAIAEFMWRSKRNGSTRDRMCEEMMNDLKFALACKSSTKPARRRNCSRARRRLQRQQESILSQCSNGYEPYSYTIRAQHHQQQLPKNNDCDPILLHAMLTMLMQQQQQNAQATSTITTTAGIGQFATSVDAVPSKSAMSACHSDPQIPAVDMYQHGRRQDMYSHRPMQHSATVDENMNRMLQANNQIDGTEYGNLHCEMVELHRQQQVSDWADSAMSANNRTSDTSRRRILHAQKTIDME